MGYETAAIPVPWQILGLRLKPFSLGHYWILRRLQNAYVGDRLREPTIDDLLIGVLVCSKSFDEMLEFLRTADLDKEFSEWAKATGLFNFQDKSLLFIQYLDQHLRQPVILYDGDSRESNAGWDEALYGALIRLGYTAEQARALPMSQAFSDFYLDAERQGILEIADEQTTELMRQAEDGTGGLGMAETTAAGFALPEIPSVDYALPEIPSGEVAP